MATAKQIAANRRNSEKSCGPKSEETKQKVAQNRLKHGLSGGNFRVIEGESQEIFDEFLQGFIRAEQPVDEVELDLVGKMARSSWMSERAIRCQNGCFLVQPQSDEQKTRGKCGVGVRTDLDLHLRYQTAHDRAYSRAAADLHKHRERRRLAEIGFEREKRAQADEIRKQNQERRRQNEELRRANAAQHRENQENRREADYKVTNAIKNEELLQQQFNTARAAVAFEQLNARHLAA
ncbi:MAG TPA: hypothetical protein VH302_03475 [Bryobacteraceae bacterium]|nr:hypothetical protein [Bryobacteraceae bacterium]